MSEQQRTIAKELFLTGVGIHTGQAVSLRVLPAEPNVGVVFVRSDLPHRPAIPVKSVQVVDESQSFRRTTLTKDGVQVQTVEHFMAALWGMGIDNVYAEVSGSEMPGLDGSSAQLLAQLKAAGTVEQPAPRLRPGRGGGEGGGRGRGGGVCRSASRSLSRRATRASPCFRPAR